MAAHMLMLNAIEQADSRCFCLLDTGANALVLPRKDDMLGTEAQCTVPGGTIVPGTVVQTLHYGEEDYHVVAIDGASPLMPLPWLIMLAGWSYVPEVKEGRLDVTIVSPRGMSVTLVESLRKVKDALHRQADLLQHPPRCMESLQGLGWHGLRAVGKGSLREECAPCGQCSGGGTTFIHPLPGHEHEQERVHEEDRGPAADH